MHKSSLTSAGNVLRSARGVTLRSSCLLTGLTLLLILFGRRPEMFIHPQFWAEDGQVFFVCADAQGLNLLLTPYAGYLHGLPRLIAAAAALLPAVAVPGAYFLSSMGITLAVAFSFFSARIDLSHRSACVLAIGLIPHSGEVMGSLTNLQWLTALGLVWLLLVRDAATYRQFGTDCLISLSCGITGIFSIFFAPLFLWRAWQRDTPASITVATLVVGTALLQAWTLWQTGLHADKSWQWDYSSILFTIGLRLPIALATPAAWSTGVSTTVIASFGLAYTILLPLVAVWPGKQQSLRIQLVLCSCLLIAGTLFRFRTCPHALASIANGDRYFFLPKLLGTWLLLQGLVDIPWRRCACTVALGFISLTTLTHWRYERWHNYDWPHYARQIEAGQRTDNIPINPEGTTFSHLGRISPQPQ